MRSIIHATAMLMLAAVLTACGAGGSGTDQGAIDDGGSAAENVAPTAAAGADRTVNEGASVTLDGSISDDADGAIEDYAWQQIAGPIVGLADADTPTPTFVARAVTARRTLRFRLTVTDGRGATDTDSVDVFVEPVNLPPTAADDAATTPEDTPITIAVLANDTDPDDAAESGDGPQINPATVTVTDVVGGIAAANSNGTVAFSSLPNFHGSASFRYTVRDVSAATSNAALVRINVTSVNDVPTISDITDGAIAEDGTTGALAFTVGDLETAAAALAVTASSSNAALVPPAGLVLGGSGADRTLSVTPAANASGAAQITVTVTDGSGGSASDTFTLTVTPVNDAPVAQGASANASEDAPLDGALAASDVDGESLTFSADGAALNGSVAIAADGGFRFTPAANFHGAASFGFKACDAANACSSAAVSITVTPVNDAPVANAGSATTVEDTAVSGTATASDVEGDARTFSADGTPVGGTVVVGTSGAWQFTPSANFNGAASFGFKACDSAGACGSAAVSITVTAVNDAPVADDGSASTAEDTAVAGTLAASDVDGNTLTFSKNGAETGGTVVISGNGYTFTPAANFSGPASFGFKACDPAPLCDTATVSITVTSANDAPTVSNIPNQSTAEDTAKGPISFTVADSDHAPATLTLAGTSSDQALVPDAAITFGGSGANRTVTVTPAANRSGAATITVTATDGAGATGSDSFVLTVNGVNDAPTVSDIPDQSTTEDTPTGAIPFTVTDPENQPVTVSAEALDPTLVSIALGGSGADRTITLTPAANRSGSTVITVTASDGSEEAGDTFVFTVSAVNDAPTISAIDDRTIAEDGSTGAIAFTIGDSDTAVSSLTLGKSSGNTTLVPTANIVFGGSGASRTVTVTPAADQSGSATITVTVSDGTSTTSEPFVLTVTAVNDAPVAADADFSVAEGGTLNGTLTGSDAENAPLTFSRATAPASGSATVNADGSFSYTPNLNFSGSDSFTFTVSDGTSTSSPATASITVNDVAEAALSVDDVSVSEGADEPRRLRFTVSMSRVPDSAVTVSYATQDGTARAGADYTATSGTLSFSTADTLAQTVDVPVGNDSFDENDELLTLAVTVTAGAGSTAGNADGTGTIVDDDTKNLLRAGAAKVSITPSDGQIAGQTESYSGGTRTQFFHLGGFGIGPIKIVPSAGGATPEFEITQAGNDEARARCYARAELDARRTAFDAELCDDHTWVRVLSLQETAGDVVLFVTIDAVGAGNLIQNGMKAAIVAAAAAEGVTVAPDNVLFGQTHSHAGADLQGLWGGVPREWIDQVLYAAGAEAARTALRDAAPANLVMARGIDADFNSYRRPKVRGDEEVDTMITVLQARADGDEDRAIGTILQYAAHPTAVGTGDYRRPDGTVIRVPHPDYPLGAENALEESFGGTALYYNGPIADASGSGPTAGATKYEQVKDRGRRIAQRATDFLADHPVTLDPVIGVRHATATLPVTNPAFLALGAIGTFNGYYQFTEIPRDDIPGLDALDTQIDQIEAARNQLPQMAPVAITTVSRISLGTPSLLPGDAANRLEIVTIPGESTNTFGQHIRRLAKQDPANVAAPDTHTMLLGLTQNSFGYIIPEEEFGAFEPPVPTEAPYEETVSLGPLTAPLLRTQAYNVLFDVAPEGNVPPYLTACLDDPYAYECVLSRLRDQFSLDVLLDLIAGGLEQFAESCHEFADGTPFEALCDAAETLAGFVGSENPGESDVAIAPLAADMAARGCDILDPAHCLFPFPSDHFTIPAPAGSPQSAANGGTGRRVNFNIAAMPRNSAGKPVDPTEWNRNDGFSPGQLVVTYVPGLAANADGSIPGAAPITDVEQSLADGAPIFVIDADTGERHLVWAEIDLNANLLFWQSAPEVQAHGDPVNRPQNDGRAALIIRPAKNFREGHRYIVALRNLKDAAGNIIAPSDGFRVCRGDVPSALRELTPVKERCDHILDVLSTLEDHEGAGFDRDELFLVWDFTVASAANNVGRLAHMRDDAFNSLATATGADCTQHADGAPCAAPKFTIDKVSLAGEPGVEGGIARKIEGTITVPSYVVPADSPLDNAEANTALQALCANAPGPFQSGCFDMMEVLGLAQGANPPPNRLYYDPTDAPNPADPAQALYGDGLPDRPAAGTAEMSTRFMCQVPAKALTQGPSRAGIYGHGLLDGRMAITYEGTDDMAREHNFMWCAVDLFGFATGDLVNVALLLPDVSNFPAVPDGSQQGLLNYMFLARLIAHPDGFASHSAFRDGASPLFDRREVFYDGNSQGGIVGGAVLAISKDVNRGVLGSLGMNYSTLLQRSKDFDPYSTPMYLSYTDPLDRMFLFSMIQMLWDRSENNGYAQHLTEKSDVEGGPVDAVLLNPMYGDQQVTMWSADVMARTMGIPVDYAMVSRAGKTYPDLVPGWPQPTLAYDIAEGDARFSKAPSALVNWADDRTAEPVPTGNVPHRAGRDPHDDSANKPAGRCVKSHFLHRHGRLLDVNTDLFRPERQKLGDNDPGLESPFTGDQCPPLPDDGDPVGAGAVHPEATLAAALARFADAIASLFANLAGQDLIHALNAAIGGAQQLLADLLDILLRDIAEALDLRLPRPAPGTAVEAPAPQTLFAGVAKGAIHVPVGTPLGGYLRPPVAGEYIGDDPAGELLDNIPGVADGCDQEHPDSCTPLLPLPDELRKITSPYATYSPPSRGYYDSLIAKAVALYDGNDYVVLVKTDFIGMLDEVVQDVKAEVLEKRGIDLGDGLIMSATHSHDGPGALANHSTRYFWLAMDAYQHDVYRKLVPQLADVVIAALDDLKTRKLANRPARIGHGNGTETRGINGYRRFSSRADREALGYNFDANEALRKRIGVLRVDDVATGDPLAVVINFADHGIAFDVENQYFSGDVLGSIEREVEQTFVAGEVAEPPIAMLVQNTGGDITPKSVPYDIRGIEMLGKRMAPQVRAIVDGIGTFQTAPDLRSVSQRVILNRERLGYGPDEYPYPWGAAQCGNDIAVPFADVGVRDIPGYEDSGLPVKHPYCIFSPPPDPADLADNGVAENGAFLPGDTIVTAAKIGDITLLAQPGEPLTEYGVRLLAIAGAEMAGVPGYDSGDTFVWGYAGDHVGYLLPPVEQDWATGGGAESTTTFWGWKQGQRLLDVNRDLVRALRDGTAPPADEFQVNYGLYKQIYEQIPAAQPTPSLLPGTVVEQPGGIRRFGTTRFTFEGGDPVIDTPRVVMEDAITGLPVRRANGEILDTFFEMHLKYRLVTGRHLWTVEFEAPKDWTAGAYRFRVAGKAFGATTEYDALSAPFTVLPAENLSTTAVACSAGVCSTQLRYPAVPSNYRIVDANVDPGQQAPVRGGSVTFSNGATTVVDLDTDGNGVYTATIGGAVQVAGADDFGNVTPAALDSDADGVLDAQDNCDAIANADQSDADGDARGDVCESAPFPLELCEPFSGEHFCLSDVPVAGAPLQDGVDEAWATIGGGPELPAHQLNASCTAGARTNGGRSYQVKLASESGEVISFQVLEPTTFDCASRHAGAHPLILQGHGFGGARSTSGFADYRNAGYTVVSIDQRGFGQSSGTVRVMDPDHEGRDLLRILDWVENNLDYLAYRNAGGAFVARPAGGASTASANLVAGAIGGSYGGGYQFLLHNVDAKNRLDALAPDITWHDLRYSINPGDVLKSAFGLLLTAGGEAGSYQPGLQNRENPAHRGLDPFILEVLGRASATGEFPRDGLAWFNYHSPSYWCGLNEEPVMPYAFAEPAADPNTMVTGLLNPVGTNDRTGQPAVDVLLTQGMRDTLFNFNEAWSNYQCAKVRGGDVRLFTHQSGHILNPASLVGGAPSGTPLDIQAPPGSNNCGSRSRNTATLQWFGEKLRGQAPGSALAGMDGAICVSLADNDAVLIPEEHVLAPRAAKFAALLDSSDVTYVDARDASAQMVPQGSAAEALYVAGEPVTAVPLLTIADGAGAILAGIPQANLVVSTPQMVNDAACAAGANVPTTRTGCDSIVLLGLGRRAAGATGWTLVDDQLVPVRGIGTHANVALSGIADRLQAGDELALLVYGYHPQYVVSQSRDATVPVVNVTADLRLPLYAVGGGGAPDFARAPLVSLAAGGAAATADAAGIAGCLLTQDSALCTAALSSIAGLQDCPFDESGINCAYGVLADAVGTTTLANAIAALVASCDATPAAPACALVRSSQPDVLAVASGTMARGDLVVTPGSGAASAKAADGDLVDWKGTATRIGGTAIHSRGEHIYNDFLFDAFGADDGDDARRLAALTLLGLVNSRTGRIDALQQAGNDQLDAPAPGGSAGGDTYGDATEREDGTDLTEVRWAADGGTLYFLARVAKLTAPGKLVVLVLADTRDGAAGTQGLVAGLDTAIFDRAVVFQGESASVIELAGGTPAAGTITARVNTAEYVNALEASIPRGVLERRDGSIRVAVLTARKVGSTYVPANVAYRFDEPVTIFGERAQALALFGGNIDGFATQIALADLVGGRTETAVPGVGYHERQFVSGGNISREGNALDNRVEQTEQGVLQPYGLFVPTSPAVNLAGEARLTIWTHYRGGKAHSGAAWTPRLIHQLGEEQGNFVITPRARGTSTWYTTRAHQDLFEVFADFAGKKLLNQYDENLFEPAGFSDDGLFGIDPAHVAISGYSMGGYATFLFTGLYPDLFSAGFSQSGAVTQGAWTGIGPDPDDPGYAQACGLRAPDDFPEVGGGTPCFIEANAGRADAQLNYRLLDNTRHTPITIHHGTNDELALTPGALRMGQRLLELQYRYDATTFLGYEHFTQAIMDEWRDGAHFVNLYARPENPRAVTYRVVPALVKAVNQVQPDIGRDEFDNPTNVFHDFNPDGAYWVDGLLVRDGADGATPSFTGKIDVESYAIPQASYVPVPRTVAANADTLWLTTPVLSPGSHSTPFVRHGLEWQELPGQQQPVSNSFSVTLTNLLAATLDASRMNLDAGARIDGTISSIRRPGSAAAADATVILEGVDGPMTLCVGDAAGVNVPAGGDAVINVGEGVTGVALLPGLGQACAAAGFLPSPADTPDYADLCESYGVAEAGPVCGLLRQTETDLRAECAANGGSARSCTLAGGNLHALLDTCYEQTGGNAESRSGSDAGPACRIADAFVLGVASWCRQFSNATNEAQRSEACALIGGVHISERELAAHEAGWIEPALRLQHRLGYDLPFVHSSMVATHNSFNATDDNTPPTLSGSDANQFYDAVGQLRMGVRAIEIDVHWMPGAGPDSADGRQPVVCHGNAEHFGCTNEKPLRDVLAEIRAWLDANPGEAILLYVEDNLNEPSDGAPDGDAPYQKAGAVFDDVIGDLVYRPADHGASCGDAAAVTDASSWLNVTRAKVLEDGKQVLSYAETCGNNVSPWAGLFHRKTNEAIDQGGDQVGVNYDSGQCVYSRGTHNAKWTRVWHDVTMVGAATGAGDDYITPAMARELMRCGLDMPSLDFLTPSDGRLEAMVWSWATDEPAADAGANDCAYQGTDGRLHAGDCSVPRPNACVSNTDPAAWTFTAAGGAFGVACPAGTHFSVPGSGYFNETLKEAKALLGLGEVWVAYQRDASAQLGWVSDHDRDLVLPAGAGGFGGAIHARGMLGLLGEFLSQVAQAALAVLQLDAAGVQAHLAAALDALLGGAGDPAGALLAAFADFIAALQDVAGLLGGGDPTQAPAALADATNQLVAAAGTAAGTAHALDPDNGACAPDNANAGSYAAFKGSLHLHSGYSDGRPGTVPRDYFEYGPVYGLDFMGSSEHSDNADVPMTVTDACLSEEGLDCPVADGDGAPNAFRKWDATLEQAHVASTANFIAFRGFEWTSDRFGHINVFFSRHDWNAKSTEGYTLSMESFWQWFAARPELGGGSDGLAVFNHPGREDQIESQQPNLDPAYAYNDFEYRPETDLRVVGIEAYGKDNHIYDGDNGAPAGGWYAYALDKGWHVGPVGAEDEHSTGDNEEWGKPTRAKTILIARDRSEGALREAMFARRFYAVRHNYNDVRLTYTGNGAPMGARLALGTGALVTLSGSITADVGKITALEIVTAGGQVVGGRQTGTSITRMVAAETAERWYYLRAIGVDGRPSAYSAPIWVRGGGDYPLCGEWLAGDLHVHSTYSHDSWSGQTDDEPFSDTPEDFYTLGHSAESQFRVAAARGLDYLALTDHNNVLAQAEAGFRHGYNFGVVPVRSYENSLSGHAQMHGADHVYNNGQPLQSLADELRGDGGVFQINHPAGESVDFPRDADWAQARTNAPWVDYAGDVVPDTIEVWNIAWFWQPPAPSSNSVDDAVRYWEEWLDLGERIAATGGSDNHYLGTTAVQGNGQPTTWVFATERSQRGVLGALRAGRSTISFQPPLLNGPRVVLEADADGDGTFEAVLGDDVPAGTTLRARVIDGAGAQLRIIASDMSTIERQVVHGPVPAVTPVFEYRFTVPTGSKWVRADIVQPDAADVRAGLATVCDGAGTLLCRNQIAVLAMSSALYFE